MRSRFALTIMIAVGMLMSGGGAALAVSGLSATGSAAVAQYGAPGPANGGQHPGANVIGGGVSTPQPTVQAPRQVAASSAGGGLPFTGYAAIPVLLIGLGLLVAGVMLRSRAPRKGLGRL